MVIMVRCSFRSKLILKIFFVVVAGCGKTTMIRALTEELKVDLVGWTFPVTLKSAADDLRSLASETSYPSVVDKSSTRRMLLLDDLPEVLPLKIRYEIVHVVTSLGVPIIVSLTKTLVNEIIIPIPLVFFLFFVSASCRPFFFLLSSHSRDHRPV